MLLTAIFPKRDVLNVLIRVLRVYQKESRLLMSHLIKLWLESWSLIQNIFVIVFPARKGTEKACFSFYDRLLYFQNCL